MREEDEGTFFISGAHENYDNVHNYLVKLILKITHEILLKVTEGKIKWW
jgi:hypothetical protein